MSNAGTHFSDEQMRAITALGAPMLVVAGPGSGKTTVITHRIKFLIESAGVAPADILVITFTRAAAGEMESRFKKLTPGNSYSVRFGTFHSIFYWIIKTAYNLNNSSVISEEDKRIIVEKILTGMGLSYDNKEDIISSILAQISLVKCDMIDIDNYYSKDLPDKVFRELYVRLDKELKRTGRIDFDDMMVMCYELLISRQDILNRLRREFKYILVDEFQDCNRIQYEILILLSKPGNCVYAVGDDDQSVYGFRGARPEIMRRYRTDFPDALEVYLGINYRSDRKITELSSRLIQKNKSRFNKQLTSYSSDTGNVQIIYPKNTKEENDMLVSMISKHRADGIPLERQAVLYRTNLQPRRLVYKLEQFNIPYTISDTMPNIFSHFAVRNILDYMHIAMGDNSRSTFLRIMNKPGRYISRENLLEDPVDYDRLRWRLRDKEYVIERIDKLVADIKLLARMKPYAALNFIRGFMGYDEYLKEYADYRSLDVSEFYDILDEFSMMISDMNSYGELFQFIEEYTLLISKQKKKNSDGIRLMTMHGAKGLEFDCVYIIDAVEGITPYKKSKSQPELEEERRMFYVAMTRAKHELYMFVPQQGAHGSYEKSRFIRDIEDAH